MTRFCYLCHSCFSPSFFEPPAVAGRVLWNRVCPSFRLSGRFLELYHWFFLNFGMVLEIHMNLCVTEPDFPEKFFFYPKNWENGPKMSQKQGFFEFIENFCHEFLQNLFYNKNLFYLLCSYSGKFLFLRYGPSCSQPIRLQDFLINHISRANQWNSLIFYMLIQIHIN